MERKKLQGVPLFAGLAKRDLERLERLTDEVDVPAGRTLTREGDLGHEFFVIESGTAEVAIDGSTVRTIGPGDFFGEIALLDEDRRTATVTASEPMTLVVLTRASFRSIQRDMPAVHQQVCDQIERYLNSAG